MASDTGTFQVDVDRAHPRASMVIDFRALSPWRAKLGGRLLHLASLVLRTGIAWDTYHYIERVDVRFDRDALRVTLGGENP
jgi:hypothetical protein